MKKIKFIYFDVGGVLLDYILALKKIARKLRISEAETLSLFKEHDDEMGKDLLKFKDFETIFYKKLSPTNKLEVSLIEAFVGNFRAIKETHDLVNELKDQIDIGILSNIAKDVFKLSQSQNLIPNINYKIVVKSSEVGLIKPGREIFHYALKQTNLLPSELLFIDDNKANIETAKSLGWNTVLFNTQKPGESIKEIKQKL